jgi:hypothetical protein
MGRPNKSTIIDDVCCQSPTVAIPLWTPGLFYREAQGVSSWGAWNQYEFLPISQREKNMAAYADSGKAIAPKGIECHMSTASKSMDTGKPYLFSSGTSLTIQVFDDLDIRPREVPQAPVHLQPHLKGGLIMC